jgi:hypothetical protein
MLQYAAAGALTLLLPACGREERRSETQPSTEGGLRLDLRHRITAARDELELVRARIEPAWRGNKVRLATAPDWGDYRLSVSDRSGTLLIREGFDSPLDPGARAAIGELSVRFPMPRHAFNAVIEKRRAESAFVTVWERSFEPRDAALDRSAPAFTPRIDAILANGDPASRVDIAIVGDGYRESEHAKFHADAKRAAEYLFSVDPFRKRASDFNVHAVFVASAESGITDPYLGLRRQTAFRCEYGTGATERTLSVGDTYALREAAGAVPHDFLLVLANSQRYGGSAHFGGPAVVAIDSAAAKYLVLHEFAHVIGGLAEEYYIPATDGPAYAGNVEPWHPNVTLSPEKAKWRDVWGAMPQRLDWNKAEYDRYFAGYVKRYEALRARGASEAVVEKFMGEEMRRQAALLAKNGAARRVGLFEGAHGYSQGVYRSESSCIMFSLQTERFCTACERAIERMIDWRCA